jgi:putative sterol carrier protein
LADPVNKFFDELERRGHEPLLEKAKGSLRIELTDGKKAERWLVVFDRGDISVSRDSTKADCSLTADRALFAQIVRGRANAVTAILRGEVSAEGELELLFLLQRVFPTSSPPRKPQRKPAKTRA